jgi:proteic killer suppression protein
VKRQARSVVSRQLTFVSNVLTCRVIKTFKSKSLAELWSTGRTSKIDQKMQRRILVRLDRLNVAALAAEMNVPGFDFHPLRGFDPARYSVHVNGPWCVTFEFSNGDAYRVDFEQYH